MKNEKVAKGRIIGLEYLQVNTCVDSSVSLSVGLSVDGSVCLMANRSLFSLLKATMFSQCFYYTSYLSFSFFYFKFMEWLQRFSAPTANLGRTP